MRLRLFAGAAISALFAGGAADAATFNFVGTHRGNDCAGSPFVGGPGFTSCTYKDSPTSAKCNFDDGKPGKVETNTTVFPSIAGTEFSITFNEGSDRAGVWSHTPAANDPQIVTAFVLKAGNAFSIFEWDPTGGSDFTNIAFNLGGLRKALSHITFFDTGKPDLPQVPPPAACLLLLTGLGALGLVRRRRKDA